LDDNFIDDGDLEDSCNNGLYGMAGGGFMGDELYDGFNQDMHDEGSASNLRSDRKDME